MKHGILAAIFAGLFLVVATAACGGDECGDGVCGESEDRENCPEDCAVCGDGFCDPGENLDNCFEDCFDPCTLEATGIGEQCMASAECGDGGACLRLEDDPNPRCYQICVPNGCAEGDRCEEGDVCVSILKDGNPRTHPDDQLFGVCYEMPEGDQGAYQQCGDSHGNCQMGMACVYVNDTHGSFCSPSCADGATCPDAINGMGGSCVLDGGGGQADHCALSGCESDDTCPTGMECVDLGGGKICLWP